MNRHTVMETVMNLFRKHRVGLSCRNTILAETQRGADRAAGRNPRAAEPEPTLPAHDGSPRRGRSVAPRRLERRSGVPVDRGRCRRVLADLKAAGAGAIYWHRQLHDARTIRHTDAALIPNCTPISRIGTPSAAMRAILSRFTTRRGP